MGVFNRSILLLLLFFSLFFPTYSGAQPGGLEEMLASLSGLVREVQAGKDRFEQELLASETAPYRLELRVAEIDAKGRATLVEYQLNLALLDPNLVRWEDGRDRIQVQLRSGREPVIKVLKDGEMDGYDNEAAILATDIDNAREMEALLKQAIPLAKEAWETDSALPETFDGLKQWVEENVKDVVEGAERYEQSWKNDQEHPCRVQFLQAETGSRQRSARLSWNLADLHEPSVEVEVKGKEALVSMHTQGRVKFIRVEEDGELQNYEDEIALHCAEVAEAQVLAHALRRLIALAKDAQQAFLPKSEERGASLSGLKTALTGFRQEDEMVRQSLEGDCVARYSLSTDNGKRTEESLYTFNFADLDGRAVEIGVSGSAVSVEAACRNKNKYIFLSQDGEQKNYTANLSFPAPGIPAAKNIAYFLAQLAEQCPAEAAPRDWAWISETAERGASGTEGLSQRVELLENHPCKWALTVREDGGKKSKEERYEFNLYDLDERRVELEVSGKSVSLSLYTRHNDEIIKNYTDGEKLGYVKSLEFQVEDIETGKIAAATLRKLIGSCER